MKAMLGSNIHVVYPIEMINSGVYSTLYGKVRENQEIDVNVDVCKDHIMWDEEDANNYRQLYSNKYGQIINSSSNSDFVTIAEINNIDHILWVDNRDGNNELYYTQRGLFPDLILFNLDIQFNPLSPVINGTTLFINATVFSYGKAVSNIEVKFYDGDPDINNDLILDPTAVEIGNDTISVDKDSSALASIQWTPNSAGTYSIYVWADPNNNTMEYNYSNNLANKTLEVIPGISTKDLVEGWNLISIPLMISGNNLTSILQSIQGQYDAVLWYNLSDGNDHWKHHHTSKPSNLIDLETINNTMGFWLHITDPLGATLEVIGEELTINQSIPIYPGWNLVGFPSTTNKTRDLALNNLFFDSDIDAIWTFNATTQRWEEIGPSDYFEVGRGYWVHSKVKKTWDVPL
jgi:hypothetical protein